MTITEKSLYVKTYLSINLILIRLIKQHIIPKKKRTFSLSTCHNTKFKKI